MTLICYYLIAATITYPTYTPFESLGVYSKISSAFWWIRTIICNDVAAIKPGFCPCQQNENLVRVKAKRNENGKVIFKIRNSRDKLIVRRGFKNKNGVKEFCLPQTECLSVVVDVKYGSGGFYQVVRNGVKVFEQNLSGPVNKRHELLGC